MKRLALAAALLAVVVGGLVAAQLTMTHWYRPWMPARLGRLGFPLSHAEAVREAAARNRLDPALVAAIIYVESQFHDRVQSASGAVGLMQVRPSTALEIARRSGGLTFEVADLGVPRINTLYGCYYLRYLLDRYHGSEVEALAAYNAGATNVDQWVADRGGAGLGLDDIPYPETRKYVREVRRLRQIYRHIYGAQLGPVS